MNSNSTTAPAPSPKTEALYHLQELTRKIGKILAISIAADALIEDSSEIECILFQLVNDLASEQTDLVKLREALDQMSG